MKNNVPFFALLIGYVGAITNVMTEAKSVIGFFAAIASLIASIYAIAISHRRLANMVPANPFAARSQPLPLRRRRFSTNRRNKPARRSVGKRDEVARRKSLRKLIARCSLLAALICLTGCSHVATTRARADKAFTQSNQELTEQSRALTTAVVDSLNAAPQNPPTNLARRFAIADQEIEGLPLQRIPATAALAGDPKAAADIEARFTEINSLRAHNSQLAQALRERDSALMELGAQYEAEKNKTLWRRIKTALIGTFGLSGLIALCIFCPAVIPILTRAVAWLVAKIPHLAGALGVVGKDAFDSVVKAVGQTRDIMKTVRSQDLKILDANLRTETDAAHKALINQRRAALDV